VYVAGTHDHGAIGGDGFRMAPQLVRTAVQSAGRRDRGTGAAIGRPSSPPTMTEPSRDAVGRSFKPVRPFPRLHPPERLVAGCESAVPTITEPSAEIAARL
jgi:hypothetical protein